MARLNTQLGYQTPRRRAASPYAMPQAPQAPRQAGGVTRALAGVPAAPSYQSPYADPSQSLFPKNDLPTVQNQAPAGTPQTYTPQTPRAPQSPAGYTFDLETDPILQQMHASARTQRDNAESSALAQRKQLAIDYGDRSYGTSIDAATGEAAAQNPFSVTRNLSDQYATAGHNLDESLNAHNLFYSGERIKELAQALHDYQSQQASAAGAFQSALGNVNQNRVSALIGADQSEQGAYNDAWSRALAAALGGGGGGSLPAPGAPTQVSGGVTYAGYPSQGPQIPTNPDTTGMSEADAVAAQQAATAAMAAWNEQQAAPTTDASRRLSSASQTQSPQRLALLKALMV